MGDLAGYIALAIIVVTVVTWAVLTIVGRHYS